jgi:tight adherence protein C
MMAEMSVSLTIVLVFLSVALLSGSLAYAGLERASPVRRRVRDLERDPAMAGSPATAFDRSPADDPIVKKVATFVPRSPKEMTKLQRRLALAGLHKPSHLATYMAAELVLPIVFFGLVFLVMGWSGIIFGVLAAVVGYLVPSLLVDRASRQRQKQIQNGLPDALDLLIVSIEAGLAVDQAILKCSEELQIAYPALAEELRLINVEARAGKPRIECFKNFANRTKVDDVRSLVAMLVQTDRFGTSIAQALRTYAEVSRTKRRQRAEEKAAKIGVKLVFPLVFCLFPAFFIVVLGSGIIKFIEAFGAGGPLGNLP